MRYKLLDKVAVLFTVCFFTIVLLMLSPMLFSVSFTSGMDGTDVLPFIESEFETGIGGKTYPEDEIVQIAGTPISYQNESAASTGIPEEFEEYFRPQMLFYTQYLVKKNDTISGIAVSYGLNQGTLLSINKITNARVLQLNQRIRVPNQDGVIYTVRAGDTLSAIAARYDVDLYATKIVNELFSDTLHTGTELFLPGAKLNIEEMQEINGDLFFRPVSGRLTSRYGSRSDPFGSRKISFHTGIDIGAPTGTPVKAAMAGTVIATGYDNTYGYHIIIRHHSGYQTLYGHLSVIRVKRGEQVDAGARIGDVGSTGMSTGPHLHFTVYKNGVTIDPLTMVRY
jgi:murein DD-endopeptidase MepM/ murein hydrolase activator NlpD